MSLPAVRALDGEILPPRPRYREPAYRVGNRERDGFSLHRKGASTKIRFDQDMMHWATAEWVSDQFLAKMKYMRDLELRAPRGESTACWQKVAEVPLGFLLSQAPVLEDTKRVNRFLNDSDYRALRCDGNHRRL